MDCSGSGLGRTLNTTSFCADSGREPDGLTAPLTEAFDRPKAMNVFYEFHKIVRHLQAEKIEYALIGGVALAFYAEPRFTKDIDLLVRGNELEQMTDILKREGYFKSSSPWTFKDSALTLHRFMKVEGPDEMIVDVLVAGDDRHEQVIANALEAESEKTGTVRVASRTDLIWLKQNRNSKQDQADIERLQNEKP